MHRDSEPKELRRQKQRLEWRVYESKYTEDFWLLQKLGEKHEMDSPSESLEETNPFDSLILDFSTPE